MRLSLLAVACVLGVAGCSHAPNEAGDAVALSSNTPNSEQARIADLLARMSTERKVAQLIQPQINSFTAQDMQRYRFGSYLNGGNGGPDGDEFAPAGKWLAYADRCGARPYQHRRCHDLPA